MVVDIDCLHFPVFVGNLLLVHTLTGGTHPFSNVFIRRWCLSQGREDGVAHKDPPEMVWWFGGLEGYIPEVQTAKAPENWVFFFP